MGSSRPSQHYNSVNNRWEIRGKAGKLLGAFDDYQADIGPLRMFHRVGSPAALAAIGTNPSIGSIPVIGVRANDGIFAIPRVALPAGILVGNFRVSGSENVNFHAGNFNNAVTGSLAGFGWDVWVMRP